MKKLSYLAVMAMVMMGIAFASCDSGKSVVVKTEVDSVSYIVGSIYGLQNKEQLKQLPGGSSLDMDIILNTFIKMFKDESAVTPEETQILGMDIQTAVAYVSTYIQNFQTAEAEANRAVVDKFLAENGAKNGVITTESGLQYQVITLGTGARPTAEDEVLVHYHGTELDGTIFDSSVDRGEPAQFVLGGVIQGWTEGVQLMPVGSKFKFWIREELAYGPVGSGHPLSGKFLTFEVELLDIVKP